METSIESSPISSDDCQIIDYIPADTPKKHSASVKAEVNSSSWKDEFIVKQIIGDGHCIARCFAEVFNEDLTVVLLKLRNEFKSNLQRYLEYSTLEAAGLMNELDEYINLQRYDSSTIDLILLAFSKVYDCDVTVFHDSVNMQPQIFRRPDTFNNEIRRISLLKNDDHYNLLVPVESVLGGNSSIPESLYEDQPPSPLGQSMNNEQNDFEITNQEKRNFKINYENPSAESLLRAITVIPEDLEEPKPVKGVRENKVYTLRNFNHDDIMCDDNGAYRNTKNVKTHYSMHHGENGEIKTQIVHFDGENFYIKKREGRMYVDTKVPLANIYSIERTYRENKSINGLRHLVVRIKSLAKDEYERYCCIIYSRSVDSPDDDVVILPHGNSKHLTAPYVRTAQHILESEDRLLEGESRPSMVYDSLLKETNPFTSTSQSEEPRNVKQVENRKYKNVNTSRKENIGNGSNDEVSSLIMSQREKSFIRNISVTKDAYYVFIYNERQLNDIQRFCCVENNPVPLAIDTTFNLCDLWLTDTSYKNKRLQNLHGGNPVFFGPAMLHFTKGMEPFSRFAAELVVSNAALQNIKFIGVDMETAIFKGFKAHVPTLKRLICVRHLKARDETKIAKLLDKTKQSGAQKAHSKSEVIKDIYGERIGGCYQYGLAESDNEEDFLVKLESLKDKWNALVPHYYDWFIKHRKTLFIESVINSARKDAGVSGLYYQNDVESLHSVEKCIQNYKKEDVLTVISNLEHLSIRQDSEEVRSLYGAGKYQVSELYKQFKVDSCEWHTWSEQRRRDHVEKFRSHVPNISESFSKPKNVGRKPCFQKRQRQKEPDIIIDRHRDLEKQPRLEQQNFAEETNRPTSSDDHQNIESTLNQSMRFADPRQETAQLFELHLRELLPKNVSKCQGNCGKKISTEDLLVLKSFGPKEWTDKSTGERKVSHGPLYVHFNDSCLKSFDKKKIYSPDQQFEYEKIKVDSESLKKFNEEEIRFLRNLGIKNI